MDRKEIEVAAAAWIFKRDAGDWSPSDDQALAAWLEASTAHRVVFLRLDAAWREAARLKAFKTSDERTAVPESLPTREDLRARPFLDRATRRSSREWRPRSRRFWALAASVLMATTVATVWMLMPRAPSYRTGVGGLEGVSMSDGSKVTLNTDSEIRVAVTETERRVDLKQGEAFFDVAKDPTRPFVVAVGHQRVIAVGTQFSVRRDHDDVQVVVSEGRVLLQRSGGDNSHTTSTDLTAGTVARTGGDGLLIQKKPPAELEQYLSWRGGFLVFRDTALADAVAEFNRYNTQRIVIEDARLAGLRIDGNFRSDNVDAFLRLLQGGFPVDIEHRDGRTIVRAR
jgi:transmembrane sensor